MGIFNRNREVRSRAITVQSGSGLSGVSNVNLTGLWASAIRGKGSQEIARFIPHPDDAGTASAVAARCLDLITQSAASRPLVITTGAGEAVDHVLERLFNERPNDTESAVAFRMKFWHRMNSRGQAFIVLDRGKSRVDDPKSAVVHFGRIDLVPTPPTPYQPHGGIGGFRVYYGDNQWASLAPSEVLWVRYPDPADPWGALAPVTAALDAIGLASAAREWQAGQLANGANPSGIVYAGNPSSDEDYEAVRAEIEAALSGPSGAGRIAVFAGPPESKPEFIKTSFSAAEVGFLDTLQVAGEEIALALGVPLDLVGGQRTYANVEASWQMLWEGTIAPRLTVVASEINRQLLAGTGMVAAFDLSDVAALQENQDALTARVKAATETDILTIDEARAELGRDPLPNGEGAVTLTAFRAAMAPSPTAAPVRSVSTDVDTLESRVSTNVDTEPHPEFAIRGITKSDANKALDRLEPLCERSVQRLARAIQSDMLKRLNRGKRSLPDANDVFNPDLWLERAYDYLLPAVSAALDAGVAGTAEALGVDIAVDALTAQAANQRALVLADQVNQTTAKVLRDRLSAAALTDSLTIQEFTDVIESVCDDLAGYRAETIARTEMLGSLNGGSRLAAVNSEVVKGRIWASALDNRTRDTHAEMDGQRIDDMDTPWTVGGTSLMYPGDPSGDPAETINCRCVEQYVTDFFN